MMGRELYSSASSITNRQADLVTLAASQSTYANETAARRVSRRLTTRLVYRNYKQIFIHYGRSSVRREVPGSEGCTQTLLLLDDYSPGRK